MGRRQEVRKVSESQEEKKEGSRNERIKKGSRKEKQNWSSSGFDMHGKRRAALGRGATGEGN